MRMPITIASKQGRFAAPAVSVRRQMSTVRTRPHRRKSAAAAGAQRPSKARIQAESIAARIDDYIASQPPQLYRGGS